MTLATMATLGVRSGSSGVRSIRGNRVAVRVERTHPNGRERSRILAMQKVVGSNPIIRSFSQKPRKTARFFMLSDRRFLRDRSRDRLAVAHCCPFNRSVVRLPMFRGHPISLLRRLRLDLQREPRILMPELVGRVAHVVTARATEARVGAAQRVEGDPLERRDTELCERVVRLRDRRRENVAAKVRGVVLAPGPVPAASTERPHEWRTL